MTIPTIKEITHFQCEIIKFMYRIDVLEKENNSLVQKVLRLEDENEHLRKKINPYEREAIKQHNMSGDSGGF